MLAFLIRVPITIVAGIIGAAIGDDAGRVIVGTIGNVLAYPIAALVSSILFFDLGRRRRPDRPPLRHRQRNHRNGTAAPTPHRVNDRRAPREGQTSHSSS